MPPPTTTNLSTLHLLAPPLCCTFSSFSSGLPPPLLHISCSLLFLNGLSEVRGHWCELVLTSLRPCEAFTFHAWRLEAKINKRMRCTSLLSAPNICRVSHRLRPPVSKLTGREEVVDLCVSSVLYVWCCLRLNSRRRQLEPVFSPSQTHVKVKLLGYCKYCLLQWTSLCTIQFKVHSKMTEASKRIMLKNMFRRRLFLFTASSFFQHHGAVINYLKLNWCWRYY